MFAKHYAICCLLILSLCYLTVNCEVDESNSDKLFENVGRELVEHGRTFVHHVVKRLMIIAPAIFFKLGIAFSLLILVTLVAVNNGFIGFLLLVVGMSSVLARLQEARRPILAPLSVGPPHHVAHYASPWVDRSDNVDLSPKPTLPTSYAGFNNYKNTDVIYKYNTKV